MKEKQGEVTPPPLPNLNTHTTPPPILPNPKKNGNNILSASKTKTILFKKIPLYLVVIFFVVAFCIYEGYKKVFIPSEFKPVCGQYKIYFDPLQNCYIFKFRDKAGGYNIYKDGDNYYCEMEVALNSREMMYSGNSYPTAERALEAVELGLNGDREINYDDNLDVEYMGEINGNGLIGHYKRGSTKERCTVICE